MASIHSFFYLFIYIFILTIMADIYAGSPFQCSRHTSRYRDVPSLSLKSSVVVDATPVMTSSRDVATEGLCDVILDVRKVFKNTLKGYNVTAGGKPFPKRIKVRFCMEGLETEGAAVVVNDCKEKIFQHGLYKNYLVFLDRAERVVNGTKRVVELVSLHQPVLSDAQSLREARKFSCVKCGRKPSVSLKQRSSMTVNLEDRLEIMCQVSGIPPPEVQWIHNGDVIDFTSKRYKRHKVKNTKRKSRLRVNKSERDDCGEYQCRVENALGESTSHSVYVIISPDTSCPAQHKHPCPQQTFCMNGGTCWVLTAVGTEFCACTKEWQGDRCQEKAWQSPVLDPGRASTLVPVSIAASVFGLFIMIAVVGVVVYALRHCYLGNRRKRNSRDSVDQVIGRDYSKLESDQNGGTLPITQRNMITYTGDALLTRDQSVQTVLSMINGKSAPFIQVQIQSAIIQPSDQHPGFQRALASPGLHHLDSVTSTGRGRLSAISTTPGFDLDGFEEVNEYLDEVDGPGVGMVKRGVTPGKQDSNGNIQQDLSPVSPMEENIPTSAPAVLNGYFHELEIPGYGISTAVGNLILPAFNRELLSNVTVAELNDDDALESEAAESQQTDPLVVNNNNNKINMRSKTADNINDKIRRDISNPDLFKESVHKESVRTNSEPVYTARVHGGNTKIRNKGTDPYDSDPEATVV